jgi:type IV secretory pathway VirB2 component (pilin)
MKIRTKTIRLRFPSLRAIAFLLFTMVMVAPAFAQANSPWESAVNVLQQAFTSTIARGLSLVAIVVSGLTFAFGEGGSKRVLAGVLFGVGMAIAAVKFNARHFGVEDLVQAGTLERWLANQLEAYVLARKNILIAGSTGSGKTSLLNVLGKFIPSDERILLIEDTSEIHMCQDNLAVSKRDNHKTACHPSAFEISSKLPFVTGPTD